MTLRLDQFPDHRFCDVVIAGSHDAGIYDESIGGATRTQKLDIREQAVAGSRFFDVRVAVARAPQPGRLARVAQKVDQMRRPNAGYEHLDDGPTPKAYHAPSPGLLGMKTHKDAAGAAYQSPVVGAFGGELDEILSDARAFVTENPSEFIFLKFAKCYGWEEIVVKVNDVLGDRGLFPRRNINTMRVSELAGHVIPIFPENQRSILHQLPEGCQMAFYKELFHKSGDKACCKAYDPTYQGLQYFGKYSNTRGVTWDPRPAASAQKRADYNEKKQAKYLHVGAQSNPDIVGMMYWTATGYFQDVLARDAKLDKMMARGGMDRLFQSHLREAIAIRADLVTTQVDATSSTGHVDYSVWMPNIVMIDGVAKDKCDTVYGLNTLAKIHLDQFADDTSWHRE